jgi:hypothetical protein
MVEISGSLSPLLTRLGDQLKRHDLAVAVAESMTAGLLAASLADLPEASKRFLGRRRQRGDRSIDCGWGAAAARRRPGHQRHRRRRAGEAGRQAGRPQWPGGRATNRIASVEAAIGLAAEILSAPR